MWNYDVIILDSGIDDKHEIFKNVHIDAVQIFCNENQDFQVRKQEGILYGHGTAVASIIVKNKENISILSVNILHCEFETDEETLKFALRYILNNCSSTIINMSLGITFCDDKTELRELCLMLVNKGFILVSAFDNDGAFSYPAAFETVIGVRSSNIIFSSDEYELYNDAVVNIGAFGKLQQVAWSNNGYIFMGGNSLACAHITSCIVSLLKKGYREYNQIYDALKMNAKKIYQIEPVERTKRNGVIPFKLKKAAIFPFNKEMHSLIRYDSLLSFQICDIYDTKYSMLVGGYTDKILKDSSITSIKIKNIENISFDNIDTLILGHIQEVLQFPDMGKLYEQLIEKIIKNKVNLYSFDRIKNERIEKHYCPYVTEEDMPMRRFGMQYKINKPVVGVFGTSSKQGKFSFQLMLRKLLQEKGYKVGQLGTEPSSLLFGMDEVYPIGYNTAVDIKDMDSIIYLNNIMEAISNKDNDIIIVGCQSGTVTYSMDNVANCCIGQYEFLLGTQPDVVFLCVNPFDEITYINRSINFIESSVNCLVIGLIMFPMNRKKDWTGSFGKLEKIHNKDYIEIKRNFEAGTNKKVFLLSDMCDMEQTVDTLINALSED